MPASIAKAGTKNRPRKTNKWPFPGMILRILLAAFLLLAPSGRPAAAQTGLEIQFDRAQVVFPDEIRFEFSFKLSEDVERVSLLYATNARTCQNAAARQSVDFEPDGDWTLAEWKWDLHNVGSLPPGARLTWNWEITVASGQRYTTPEQEISIEDPRYTWNRTSYGGISVYWTDGASAFGQRLLELSVQSLARLSREMGIDAPENVRLMVYPGAEAVQDAGINLPDWTGGFAVPEYSTVMLGIHPDELAWAETIIPHELAHLVSDQRIFNCKGADMPTWLSEGISVAAEGPQVAEERQLVITALENDNLPELRSLSNGFAANSQRANLSYAQSGMVVRYILETAGGLDRLLQSIQDGQSIDRALESSLGLDTEGLDAAWRESLGFAAADGTAQPVVTRTPRPKGTAIPTLVLWTQAAEAATVTPGLSATTAPTDAVFTPSPTLPESIPQPARGAAIWPFLAIAAALTAAAILFAARRTSRR